MIAGLLIVGLVLGSECDFEHNEELPFSIAFQETTETQTIFELWIRPEDDPLRTDVFEVFEAKDIALLVVVPAPPKSEPSKWLEWVERAHSGGHSVAFHLPPPDNWATQPYQALRSIRSMRKRFKKISGRPPVAIATTLPNKRAEASLLRAGFHVILENEGPHTNTPRLAAYFPNQMKMGLILPQGKYKSFCGDPLPWTSEYADAISQAIILGARGKYTVTRVPLSANQPRLAALSLWLEQNFLLHQSATNPVEITGSDWKRAVQRGIETDAITQQTSTGRRFPARYVIEIAEILVRENPLPRRLAHGLNLTEAYAALIGLLSQEEGQPVVLANLLPPQHLAISNLMGDPVSVSRQGVIDLAKRLALSPGTQIPAAVRVDGKAFTAAEFLVLMSQAALGYTSPTTELIRVPDPRSKDLGWGVSQP